MIRIVFAYDFYLHWLFFVRKLAFLTRFVWKLLLTMCFPILCTMFVKLVFINKICVVYLTFYKHLSLKTIENTKNKFYNLQNAELIIILPR